MSDPTSFRGTLGTGGRRQRRVTILVALLAVAFVAVAIAKPWGDSVAPAAPSPGPAGGVAESTPPPPSPVASPSIRPASAAFTTPTPPAATAAWTAIRWHRLAPGDPLALVRSVVRWRGGFVALGRDPSGGAGGTPLWTSQEGVHWELLPANTSTTFWPGLRVVAVAEAPAGLVALSELGTGTDCAGAPACRGVSSAVISWTSADGKAWVPSSWIALPADAGGSPLLAVGPAGLVAVSSGATPHGATSGDGVTWHAMPNGAFPKGFSVSDLRATVAGYVVAGVTSEGGRGAAATLWSTDGRTWTLTGALPPAAGRGIVLVSTGWPSGVESLVAGRDGLVAEGEATAAPGAAQWWQTADGRHWRRLDGYPPLGPTTCTGAGCGREPAGVLVGDGERMVALRGGPDARAWTSYDGLSWVPLGVEGDLPTDQATRVTILPGGVLLSDGSTTWFGEALTNQAP